MTAAIARAAIPRMKENPDLTSHDVRPITRALSESMNYMPWSDDPEDLIAELETMMEIMASPPRALPRRPTTESVLQLALSPKQRRAIDALAVRESASGDDIHRLRKLALIPDRLHAYQIIDGGVLHPTTDPMEDTPKDLALASLIQKSDEPTVVVVDSVSAQGERLGALLKRKHSVEATVIPLTRDIQQSRKMIERAGADGRSIVTNDIGLESRIITSFGQIVSYELFAHRRLKTLLAAVSHLRSMSLTHLVYTESAQQELMWNVLHAERRAERWERNMRYARARAVDRALAAA